jgi:hypothetical protein
MSWEEEQERLVRQARLYTASPEAVFEELKRLGRLRKIELLTVSDEAVEPALLERNEPLINLGLACYCTHREVFKALYKHSLSPVRDEADMHYKRGLRIGCLSNQVVTRAHFLVDFPEGLIGADETRRILAQGTDHEIMALLRNPSLSAKLLEALYSRTGLLASIDEERWSRLVSVSSKNERINTEIDYHDSPDMEHYSIHKAIFRLLGIAPLEPAWLHVCYNLLVDLDFQQTATVENIDGVLARWTQIEDRGSDGQPFEGHYTSLPLKDELRCLIAAMYGHGFTKSKTILHGHANANDIALRCAFYGKGEITAKDMKAGYKRDKDVYAFAVLFNSRLYSRSDLRTLYEEEHVSGHLHYLFERNVGLVKKRWNEIDKRDIEEPEAQDDTTKRLSAIETTTDTLTKSVAALAKELADIKYLVVIIAIALAILIYWSKH